VVNDARIVSRENIVRCCIGCNASKGSRALADGLQSRYCLSRGISSRTVAPVIRAAIATPAAHCATHDPVGHGRITKK
jgi:hypothetical protein